MHVCGECGQHYERAGYCAADGQPLAETSDPLLGTEVGRYRLARLVGEGGMGQVYLGVQPVIGSRVAIKILSDQCARNPELLERFFAEARAVNLIRHESIVSVIDMAQLPDGRPYIVLEFVEGQTLGAIVRAARAPLGGLVQIAIEMLSALGAAHAIGIVHRDLKPDNVLVTVEGHAKVLDFGIAKLAPGLSNVLSPRTRTGALLGTPAYMAPEQISGSGHIDARTDIYAAGILLYESVTGRVPFQGATLFDLMKAHLEQQPPSPRALRPDLPLAVEQVILRALAKDPAHRFQTAAEMADALRDASSSLPPDQWRAVSSRGGVITGRPSAARLDQPTPDAGPTHATPVPQHTTEASTPSRRLGLAIAIVATATVGGGIILIAMSGRGSPDQVAVTEPPAPAPSEPTGSAGSPAPVQPPTPAPPVPVDPPAPVQPPTPAPPVPVDPPAPRRAKPAPTTEHEVPAPNGVTVEGNVKFLEHDDPMIKQAADYDPKHFDPVAYLPKAQKLARRLLPDAALTTFEFDPVFPDGHVDLTMDGRDRGYDFRSPSKSAFPPGRPKNLPLDRACRVMVELTARTITARVVSSDSCDAKLVRAPRCSFAGVWNRAKAAGVRTDVVARIGWLFDENWFFDIDLAGKGGGVSTFVDTCP